MKLDDGYEMRTLGGQNIIVPAKVKDVDFTHILTLNESAALMWKRMTEGEFTKDDLVATLTDTYDVTPEAAGKDVETFVNELRGYGMIDD